MFGLNKEHGPENEWLDQNTSVASMNEVDEIYDKAYARSVSTLKPPLLKRVVKNFAEKDEEPQCIDSLLAAHDENVRYVALKNMKFEKAKISASHVDENARRRQRLQKIIAKNKITVTAGESMNMHEQLATFVNSNANPYINFKRTSNIKKALSNIAKKAEKKLSAHIFYSYNPSTKLMEPVTANGKGVLPSYPSTFEDLLDSPEKRQK